MRSVSSPSCPHQHRSRQQAGESASCNSLLHTSPHRHSAPISYHPNRRCSMLPPRYHRLLPVLCLYPLTFAPHPLRPHCHSFPSVLLLTTCCRRGRLSRLRACLLARRAHHRRPHHRCTLRAVPRSRSIRCHPLTHCRITARRPARRSFLRPSPPHPYCCLSRTLMCRHRHRRLSHRLLIRPPPPRPHPPLPTLLRVAGKGEASCR